MASEDSFRVAVVPGDGVGLEVMDACLAVLNSAQAMLPELKLDFIKLPSGAGQYANKGEDITAADWASLSTVDAILFGASGLPEVRYPNGTEVDTPIKLREHFNLTASIRPVQSLQGISPILTGANGKNIDFIVIRETTEGLFAGRNSGTIDKDNQRATNTMTITQSACERLFKLTFELAKTRKRKGYAGRVTLVDKANVISCLAFMRKVFYECAAEYPDIEVDHLHVDAAALLMVRDPHRFDIIVTENQFGDILSELGAGLVGGLGVAPSSDISEENAVFQPSHGSGPDITGQNVANPVAMILSAAMMLEWLFERSSNQNLKTAAEKIRDAVNDVLSKGFLTRDVGGNTSTTDFGGLVVEALEQQGAT